MTDKEKSKNTDEKLARAFLANEVTPNAAEAFLAKPEKLEKAVETADIILDTNVLLLPYGAGTSSLKQVIDVYTRLCSQKRIYIPAQAAREFIRNRPKKIADLYNGLNTKVSTYNPPEKISYAILEGLDEVEEINDLLEKAKELKKDLNKKSASILKQIKKWEWDDPVSAAYKNTFSPDNFHELDIQKEKLFDELQHRYQLGIPPGYKDGSKDDSGIGDLLIWKSILEIGTKNKKDLIFVSGDEKADWQHSAGGVGYLPRHELIDEYRRHSGGRSLYIIALSKLLELFEAEQGSIEEIKKEEERILSSTTVSIHCPYCEHLNEALLGEDTGSSCHPICTSCEERFHVHRTRDGITTHRKYEKSLKKSASDTDDFITKSLETVPCPVCNIPHSVELGTRKGSTCWSLCNICEIRFPIHRGENGAVILGSLSI